MVIDSYLLATSPKRKVLLADISYKFWHKVVITLGILSKMLLLDIYEWLFVYWYSIWMDFFEKGAHPFHKERICQLILNFGSSQFLSSIVIKRMSFKTLPFFANLNNIFHKLVPSKTQENFQSCQHDTCSIAFQKESTFLLFLFILLQKRLVFKREIPLFFASQASLDAYLICSKIGRQRRQRKRLLLVSVFSP